MGNIVRTTLNRRTVDVVTPKCFANRFYVLDKTRPASKCLECPFVDPNGEECAYEEYRTDTTRGFQKAEERYKGCDDDDDLYFVHFNCVTCGELISNHSERITVFDRSDTLICKHCGTPHIYLYNRYTTHRFEPPITGDEMIFAVPVHREKYRDDD